MAAALFALLAGASLLVGDRRLDGVSHFPWSNLLASLKPSHQVYNTTDAIHDGINALVEHSASLCSGAISHEPRTGELANTTTEVQVIRLTSGLAAPKNKILLSFGIHGREYVTGELALSFIHKLCDGSVRSKALLDTADFMIVPVANVAGRKKVEHTDASTTCADLRKNENNVDLNRNFDFAWSGGDDTQRAEDFRGPSPNSEPEVQLLDALARRFQPKMFIDVHSGDTTMMYPHSYQSSKCSSWEAHQALADVVNLKAFGCAKGANGGACPSTGAAAVTLNPPYLASGSSLDYMYERRNVSYSFTWEIFSGRHTVMGSAASAAASAASVAASQQLLQLDSAPAAAQADLSSTAAPRDGHEPLSLPGLMPHHPMDAVRRVTGSAAHGVSPTTRTVRTARAARRPRTPRVARTARPLPINPPSNARECSPPPPSPSPAFPDPQPP